jgi:hypothetical protein
MWYVLNLQKSHLTIANWWLTTIKISEYPQFTGCYLTGLYYQWAMIVQSPHGSTLVGVPERPPLRQSTNDLPIGNIPVVPTPADNPHNETVVTQMADPKCTPHPTKLMACTESVGEENAGVTVFGKATGLYNRNRKYSELLSPYYPFWSS